MPAQPIPQPLLTSLADLADQADAEPRWPRASWEVLRQSGALAWSIPQEYGGQGRESVELLSSYEALAGACLTSCFILSQRDAACRRLQGSANQALCRELLPPLARGETFATVGLSQLTTSRQHLKPALLAQESGAGLLLHGTIPWVTGASQADHFIIGATLEDGRQILAVLPASVPGVSVGPPLELMALQGSITAEVRCDQVVLDRRWLLAGPAERVMAAGRGGTGGLETSCLALGLAGAAIAYLEQEAVRRPELRPGVERLTQTRGRLRQELQQLAQNPEQAPGTPSPAVALRGRANNLVLWASQAALTAGKGTAFLRHHPVERWARQALFFLVWSCPWPAASATLDYLAAGGDQECP
jgi:alkylation response protein AidB-like acyl-CoA dehydrogenase